MVSEAQRIVDELSRYVDTLREANIAIPGIRSRILAAASKPKHPTPDKFVDDLRLAQDCGVSAEVIDRQLDTARHAISHLRHLLETFDADDDWPESRFLRALYNGDDFPEAP
jgi:succinate dehydrogenase/fumarate reductase flavoprotein subunit